jgi:hypothetical protein
MNDIMGNSGGKPPSAGFRLDKTNARTFRGRLLQPVITLRPLLSAAASVRPTERLASQCISLSTASKQL